MTTLIVATRNAHKVQEIRAILGPQFHFLTLRDFPAAPPVIEDAATFAGNAAKKAMELARWLAAQTATSKLQPPLSSFVLADDSGLEVDALHGAPGVHSARFAALDSGAVGNSSDAENNAKLLRLLHDTTGEKRTARFRCVLALTSVNAPAESNLETFDGTCEGRMLTGPSGRGGFGYDPLFVPAGYEQSFAELGEEVKNRLSHRAKALAGLRERLLGPA